MLEHFTLLNIGTALIIGGLTTDVTSSVLKQYNGLTSRDIQPEAYNLYVKLRENSHNLVSIGLICYSIEMKQWTITSAKIL